MTLFERVFQKKIEIPNPLWYIVGYGIVYPYKTLRRLWLRRFPKKRPPNLCSCGEPLGDSLWSFCSPECLEDQVTRYNERCKAQS